MAYGCQASLDHATSKLERAQSLMGRINERTLRDGHTTEERVLLFELASAVAYLSDAVRYLKDGVP